MFPKFYEIPSLPFQDTEKPKCRRQTDGLMDGQGVNSISPPPPTNTVCMPLPFQDIKKPNSREQMDGKCENSIPPTSTVCWGWGGWGGIILLISSYVVVAQLNRLTTYVVGTH